VDYTVAPHGTVVFVRRIGAAFRDLGSTTFVTLAQKMKPFATGHTLVAIQQLVRDQDQLGRRFAPSRARQ